jgi:hypothetical protein
MHPRQGERISEDIKATVTRAEQQKAHRDTVRVEADAETTAAMFQPVLTEAGNPLGFGGVLNAAVRSFG